MLCLRCWLFFRIDLVLLVVLENWVLGSWCRVWWLGGGWSWYIGWCCVGWLGWCGCCCCWGGWNCNGFCCFLLGCGFLGCVGWLRWLGFWWISLGCGYDCVCCVFWVVCCWVGWNCVVIRLVCWLVWFFGCWLVRGWDVLVVGGFVGVGKKGGKVVWCCFWLVVRWVDCYWDCWWWLVELDFFVVFFSVWVGLVRVVFFCLLFWLFSCLFVVNWWDFYCFSCGFFCFLVGVVWIVCGCWVGCWVVEYNDLLCG